jgi:hypothetical protein
MNFIKRNVLLLSILGGFLILFGVSVFLLINKIAESKAVIEELTSKKTDRENLWQWSTFLSEENVKKIKNNAQAQEEETQKILKFFSQSVVPAKQMKGVDFQKAKFNTLNELRKLLTRSFVAIPDKYKYQFGFETYSLHPPDDKNTPLLEKQLEIVRELMDLCCKAQVEEIKQVKRVEFESVTGNQPNHDIDNEPLVSLGDDFSYFDNAGTDYLYSSMPFDIEIYCVPESLRSFLNSMSHSKYLLIPRIIKIDNEKKERVSASEKEKENRRSKGDESEPSPRAKRSGSNSNASSSAVDKKKEEMVDPLSAPLLVGDERITVRMRIDWLEMAQNQEPLGKPGQPPKPAGGKKNKKQIEPVDKE